eukprot:COSAG06_NODE_70328_length_192_cov_120.806452_1_plen_46_part_01
MKSLDTGFRSGIHAHTERRKERDKETEEETKRGMGVSLHFAAPSRC